MFRFAKDSRTQVPHSRIIGLLLCLFSPATARADHGQPLAIRFWPHNVVSVETHWNFEIALNLSGHLPLPKELRKADLTIAAVPDSHGLFELTLRAQTGGNGAAPTRTLRADLAHVDHFLDRLANQDDTTCVPNSEATFVSPNAVHFTHDADQLLLIYADGVRLAIATNVPSNPAVTLVRDGGQLPPIDAWLIPNFADATGDQRDAMLASLRQRQPRVVVVPASAKVFVPAGEAQVSAIGNTLPLSSNTPSESMQWALLNNSPWSMPQELADLFAKMEQACEESQARFASLSVTQLNFKPSNGTHTPRWNCEHMMGRELLFFSQIFAKQCDAIQPIDLNPEQMPPDYQAAHADWKGTEEARQMQRVSAFTRRFAFLLNGLDLDQKAPGSYWTPRGLLAQMQRHYSEHTANVVKKFELPDWPKE